MPGDPLVVSYCFIVSISVSLPYHSPISYLCAIVPCHYYQQHQQFRRAAEHCHVPRRLFVESIANISTRFNHRTKYVMSCTPTHALFLPFTTIHPPSQHRHLYESTHVLICNPNPYHNVHSRQPYPYLNPNPYHNSNPYV